MQDFTNNAASLLTTGVNSSATSLVLADASKFPTPAGGSYFYATLIGLNTNGQENAWEIVKCTGKSGNTLTVERGKDNTAEQTWGVGIRVELRLTAAFADAVDNHIDRTDNPHVTTKAQVDLGNVNNTSDTDKPVSTLQQAALNLKANIVSPELTGTPTATTATLNDNSTRIATTAFVNAEIASDATPASHVGSTGTAHGAATTLVAGFMSTADKTKLEGIATSANNYSLPTASATVLGGVKIGSGLAIDGSGVVTASGATNIAQGARTPTTVEITSSTGTDATLDAVDTTSAGVMTAADKVKLNGIATNATANAGTVIDIGVTAGNGVSATATSGASPRLSFTLGSITPSSVNGLALAAAANGFTLAGGTAAKTMTFPNSLTISGTDASTLNIGTGGTLGSAAYTAASAYATAASVADTAITGKLLTNYLSGSGTVAATDTILQAVNKLNGNDTANLNTAKAYADGLVVGLWDDRGNYDASVNTFPASGGSGAAGAIMKGDIWTISVAGTLGTVPIAARQTVRAMSDAPGQTATNWAIALANTDIDDAITDGVTGRAPSQNAVFDALTGKSPAAGSSSVTTVGTVTTGTWNATVIAGQYGGTGVANTGKSITLGGNLTTAGAFATTFNMSAATSVTFPTSGTLLSDASAIDGGTF